MQLKPLVALLTAIPVVTAATSPDTVTINDISNLTNDLKQFDAAIQSWDLQENSSPAQTMKDQANKAVQDLDQTLKDAKKIDSLTPDAQNKLVAGMQEFASVAGDVVKHMAEKQPVSDRGDGYRSLMETSNKATGLFFNELQNSLANKIPQEKVQELSGQLQGLQDGLNKAIA
ncbi:uncharacterized protein EURHEDRAFT_387756 [Aspergillus ruber CBS 135680]|uniref:Hydrophobic surface binding protein A-domain-containing protein n=1 Tax=Aspergillus ruber (strain CBS 135680) TaxID=1388766 RepID=A0A017S9V9_ASPRC|nr:uncharacterized protein EURHEDRAFT_387756 [Aspergillus ruber CBS 135680]EYE93722.1 hypothetical protein EURHEDRAFT_387756 [Aspergillus ruber CBS 135680]